MLSWSQVVFFEKIMRFFLTDTGLIIGLKTKMEWSPVVKIQRN